MSKETIANAITLIGRALVIVLCFVVIGLAYYLLFDILGWWSLVVVSVAVLVLSGPWASKHQTLF